MRRLSVAVEAAAATDDSPWLLQERELAIDFQAAPRRSLQRKGEEEARQRERAERGKKSSRGNEKIDPLKLG